MPDPDKAPEMMSRSGAAAVASQHPVEFGVQLPTVDGLQTGRLEITAAALNAERLGFDSVWIGDHLVLGVPVVESVVAAAMAAAVTERIGIGFGVLVAPLRQPAWLAKQLSSLQAASNDRIILGVGVGGEFEQEWRAAGVPANERGRRLDALLDVLPALLGGQPAQLGAPWNLDVPALQPHGRLPIMWVGGRSDAALQRAVRFDAGWSAVWADAERVSRARVRLEELARAAGRSAPPISVQVLVNPNPDRRRALVQMRNYMESIYDLPFDRLERYTASGDLDAIAAQLATLIGAGASTIVMMPGSPDPIEDLDSFAEIAARIRTIVGATSPQPISS